MPNRFEGSNLPEQNFDSPDSKTKELQREQLVQQINSLRPALEHFLNKLVGKHYSAAIPDIADEAIIKAVKNLDKFKGNSVLNTWVYTIAKNTAVDFLEYAQHDLVYQAMLARSTSTRKTQIQDRIIDAGSLFEDEILKRIDNKLVYDVIQVMPKDYREAMLLKLKGVEPKEMSKILNISESSAKIRSMRAVNMFKERYLKALENKKNKIR